MMRSTAQAYEPVRPLPNSVVDYTPAPTPVLERGTGRVIRLPGLIPQTMGAADYALQCVLCLRGTASYAVRGRVFELQAGSVLWLVPSLGGPRAELVGVAASEDYSAWIGLFSRGVLKAVEHNGASESPLRGAQAGGVLKQLSKVGARRLESQFQHLATLPTETETFSVGLSCLLLSASAEYQKVTQSNELTDVHPAVGKAADILRVHPETNSMQELAQVCGASASWLSRLFRQQVGISLVGYRNQSRIERFFELYGQGQRRNLTQAAHEAGFGSYAQFHRVFKEALGYSPAELKRGGA
ncbi:MAG TPA: AraC family transcriptional regulator [Polyangiaceae bacterium]|jgi:AraC-like DNA-binding protein|nr:AraC family transcriptional regulator [Polyangiaceae bacterium]